MVPIRNFFLRHPSHPRWLFVLRAGTGVLLLLSFLAIWPDYDTLYGPGGLAELALQQSGPTDASPPRAELVPVYLVLCLFLTAGLFTRLSAILLIVLHYYLFTRLPGLTYGLDYIFAAALLYCAIFPVGNYYSVDQRLFRRPQRGTASLCLRILQLHLCMVYFFAGLGKLLGAPWHDGEALWKAVMQPGFDSLLKPDPDVFAAHPYLWWCGGWAVVAIELLYLLFICPKATRRYWLWAAICLHLGIALFMGLYFFAAIMTLWNLAAFYYPYLPGTVITDRPYHTTTPSVHSSAGRQPLHKPGVKPAG